jgi:hypothetical protein
VYDAPITDKTIRLRKSAGVEVHVRFTTGEPLRWLAVLEAVPGNDREIALQIPLDRDGVGSLPSALAGSTLMIYGGRNPRPRVIRQWDGRSFDLTF